GASASISTSAAAINRRSRSRSSLRSRSSTTLRFPSENADHVSDPSGSPSRPLRNGAERRSTQPPGGSTWITSAPRSARIRPAIPPRVSVRSTTTIPSSAVFELTCAVDIARALLHLAQILRRSRSERVRDQQQLSSLDHELHLKALVVDEVREVCVRIGAPERVTRARRNQLALVVVVALVGGNRSGEQGGRIHIDARGTNRFDLRRQLSRRAIEVTYPREKGATGGIA